MTQQIAAIRRDFDIEDGVRREQITNRPADFCLGRQNEQPGRVLGDAKFLGAAKHSFAFDSAQFARANPEATTQLRSG